MRPSAALPMGRHPTLPLATVSLSFPPLDGEDHSATETIPEITLEDRQAQRCCHYRNALVSCLDYDARLSRKKTLRRERQAQVRAHLTALPFHPTPPEPRLSSPCFRTDRDRQCHSHAHKLPWPHAQPVIARTTFSLLRLCTCPCASKMSFTPSLIMFATSATTCTNVSHVWSAITV